MYKDIHDRLTLIAGKILHEPASEFNRTLYLEIKEVKEMLTYDNDNGHLYCPLCESLVDVIEEEEEDPTQEIAEQWFEQMVVKEKTKQPDHQAITMRTMINTVDNPKKEK
jgi:hypothetical protein